MSTIAVVEDDNAMRDSVVTMLRHAGYDAKPYGTARKFLTQIKRSRPDGLLLDIRMPGMDGIQLLERLGKDGITPPTVVITGHGDVPLAVKAMKLGAADFLEKPFKRDALLKALDGAMAKAKNPASDVPASGAEAKYLEVLSDREYQVLEGLVAGHASKVIAAQLDISPRTVEVYRSRLKNKLNARSFSHLIQLAVAGGISPPEDMLDGIPEP